MRIAMIGTGYVGLVSGACFSEFGVDVTCVDKDSSKIDRLKRGEMPIYEPGLDQLVDANVKAGRLSFTTELAPAVANANAVFIAVGTPSRRGDGHADLSYVYGAAEEIGRAIKGYTAVVTKSTVPVGTGREVERIIRRVPLYLIETPILFTSLETSELIKYAANTFLATKITFINEIADLCEKLGANVHDVARGIGLDGRIGRKFLHPGPGYGGSCFPKDTLALVKTAQAAGAPLRIVETVVDINDRRKKAMAERVRGALGGSVKGKAVAVLGLTFKPNTDDMRDSPSLEIVPPLVSEGASVRVFDPQGMEEAKKLITGVTWCENAYQTMEGADALVLVTEWNEFRALDLNRVKQLMRRPVVVDLRNIYNPDDMVALGFDYSSIGRPSRLPRRAVEAAQ